MLHSHSLLLLFHEFYKTLFTIYSMSLQRLVFSVYSRENCWQICGRQDIIGERTLLECSPHTYVFQSLCEILSMLACIFPSRRDVTHELVKLSEHFVAGCCFGRHFVWSIYWKLNYHVPPQALLALPSNHIYMLPMLSALGHSQVTNNFAILRLFVVPLN